MVLVVRQATYLGTPEIQDNDINQCEDDEDDIIPPFDVC